MKRILSLLLTLAMLLSLGTVSFAGESAQEEYSLSSLFAPASALLKETIGETINYVALGDSTSMGYLMNDYFDGYVRMNYNGTASSSYSDYAQFSAYLESRGYIVNGTDLCMTGMRPSELRAILDADYWADQNTRTSNFCNEHIHSYTSNNGKNYESYEEIHSVFTDALQNADIVTYDILMGDFGLNFKHRISSLLSGDDSYYTDAGETFVQLMRENNCPEIAAGAEALSRKIHSLLSGKSLPFDIVEHAIDAALYTYANFAVNFSATVDWIYENNQRDVTVIVVGPTNPLDHLTVSYMGISLNVSQIWDCLNEALTLYVTKLDPHAGRYLFADCSAGVASFIRSFAENKFQDPEYEVYRNNWFYADAATLLDADLPTVQAALEPIEVREIISRNIQSACSCSSYHFEDLYQFFSRPASCAEDFAKTLLAGTDTVLGDFRSELPSSLGQASLLFFFISRAHSTGHHPSADGYLQKESYIEKTYQQSLSAKHTYLVRFLSFIRTLVACLMGDRASANALQTLFSHVFTPIIRINGLFKS